ncbi:efflux transporter outer membrane subunit [Parachlamydia sp. AcF125]|uniref:efflux transporter outer membrane subunit n=1 Tax=Parachlamydia sp. AcF125 TaxID=2795736 RepID=UPI001BC9A116|nr:efflux transporter outer membrane subunit [Parachlamydia sp. AcF125]MBS4168945.1 Outer membrane protein OprM [Parachlamydia sp. AcF125]
MRRWASILLGFISLAGCMRPHYDRQYVKLPDQWRWQNNEESTLNNIGWWEQLEDPVLNELIAIALKNNQDLQVAIKRVYEYYALYRVTNAPLFPSLTGNTGYNRSKSSIALPTTPASGQNLGSTNSTTSGSGIQRINHDFLASLNLNWELDFWGRLQGASDAAYADMLSQIEARRMVTITVITSVVDAYITLRGLDAQLEISKKNLQSCTKSLGLAFNRYEVGETSQLEVRQAESEVKTAAISVLELERSIPQQENLISVLLGENPHPILRGKTLDTFHYPEIIPLGLPSDLLTRRPDIVQAEYQLMAANAHVTEARALFFPQFTLTGIYGSESNRISRFLASPAEFWQYGISVVQTLFDAGKTYYQVEAEKARRDELLFTYRQTILTAFREANDALIACQKNQELVAEHTSQVKVLSDYLQLANLRYVEGEVDYLTVLDAERSLFKSQLDLTQVQTENFNAMVKLYKALGGGWVTDADKVAIHHTPSILAR